MTHEPKAPADLPTAELIPSAGSLWGQWFRRKIFLALTLTALVPLLLLAYSIFASVMSWLGHEPVYGRDLLWSQALLVFTGLLMAAGVLMAIAIAVFAR